VGQNAEFFKHEHSISLPPQQWQSTGNIIEDTLDLRLYQNVESGSLDLGGDDEL
jgi:hypothetical protein